MSTYSIDQKDEIKIRSRFILNPIEEKLAQLNAEASVNPNAVSMAQITNRVWMQVALCMFKSATIKLAATINDIEAAQNTEEKRRAIEDAKQKTINFCGAGLALVGGMFSLVGGGAGLHGVVNNISSLKDVSKNLGGIGSAVSGMHQATTGLGGMNDASNNSRITIADHRIQLEKTFGDTNRQGYQSSVNEQQAILSIKREKDKSDNDIMTAMSNKF